MKRCSTSIRPTALLAKTTLAIVLAQTFPLAGQAATLDWNASQSFWELSGAWTPSGPPGPDDVARFGLNTLGAVVWGDATGNRQIRKLSVEAGSYTFRNTTASVYALALNMPNDFAFQVSGVGTAVYWQGLNLAVGSQGHASIGSGALLTVDQGAAGSRGSVSVADLFNVAGTLNVINGSIVTDDRATITNGTGSGAAAAVSGAGSQWLTSSGLSIGGYGGSTLSVENGGYVWSGASQIGLKPSHVGSVTVTGAGSRWELGSTLAVGSQGTGVLNIEAGAAVTSSEGDLGNLSGSRGTVSVSGAGSRWTNSGALYIGDSGAGTLVIDSQGLVSNTEARIGRNAGAIGAATVRGAGSQWLNTGDLYVGDFGSGSLDVRDGGTVSNAVGRLGYNSGSTGTATVNGTGSKWINAGGLTVGYNGQGALNVEAGGVVSNAEGRLANNSLSVATATVTGAGSQWQSSADLFVGYRGNGTLYIGSGGVVSNAAGYVGDFITSIGTATVSGAGSQWNNAGTLTVGSYGKGTLTIEGGGVVSSASGQVGVFAGNGMHSMVTVSGTGSRWNIAGNLAIDSAGASGSVLQLSGGGMLAVGGRGSSNAGEIRNSDGVLSFAHDLTNAASGVVSGHGTFIANSGWTNQGLMSFSDGAADIRGKVVLVDGGSIVVAAGTTATFHDDVAHDGAQILTAAGAGTVILGAASGAGPYAGAGTVDFEGSLHPGNGVGLLGLGGDAVLGALATTYIELAGAARGTAYDALDVAGTLSLNGVLHVDLLGGYAPRAGAFFDLISADDIAGTFAGLALPHLASGLGWDLALLHDVGGSTDVLRLSVVAVPEPPAVLLLAGGLLLVIGVGRARRTG